MTRIHPILIVFSLLVALAGCSSPSLFTISTTPTPTRDVQPIATITVTSSPSSNMEQCIDVKKIEAPLVLPAGILAIYQFSQGEIAPRTRLMDLATGEFLPTIVPASHAKPSPNYTWFMFGGNLGTKPWFFGENGKLVESLYWQDDWGAIGWINDENLLISRSYKNDDGRPLFDNTLFRLDPFTGEWEKLPTDFPNIYVGVPPAGLDAWVFYDPSLTLATYISQKAATVLINTQTKQIIWEREGNLPYLGHWSPDGSQLVMPTWVEHIPQLFLVQQDGTWSQLTDIKSIDATLPRMNLTRWSPQGNYIVFSFFGRDDFLGIVNINTKKTEFYCFDNSIIWDYYWSLDEKQIALGIKDEVGWHVAIFDTANGSMYYVADNVRAAGWIPKGP